MAFTLLSVGLVAGAAFVFLPCVIALLLASWGALFVHPWVARLSQRLRGGTNAAALLTTVVVLALTVPVIAALIPIALSSITLVRELSTSHQLQDVATTLAGDGEVFDFRPLIREYSSSAWGAASVVVGVSARFLFSAMIFVIAFFALVKDGPSLVRWLRAHSPLRPAHFDRFARAYAETAHGLLVGVGLTALIQGALATVTYAVVGVPRALSLGLLTTVSALIPGFGTALFWGPIALVLAMQGHPAKAAIVALSGVFIIGTIDNILKPILSNRARLRLSPTLLFITMLSGLAAFGASGLLLAPLLVRLAIEGLEISRAYMRVQPRSSG